MNRKLNETELEPDTAVNRPDLTSTASTAESACRPDETAGRSTAATHAEPWPGKPVRPGKRPYRRKVDVIQWQTSTGHCQQCGEAMVIYRASGPKRKKFCSARCRVAAWRARHAEESATS